MIGKISLGLFIIVAVGVASISFYKIEVDRTHMGEGETLFEVKQGQSLRKVSNNLVKAGVIGAAYLFEIETRIAGLEGNIRTGEYLLPKDKSIRDILVKITQGQTALYAITFPEGFNVDQVARKMESAGFTSAKSFIEAANDRELLNQLNIKGDSAEGYLYPETYRFRKNVTAKEAVTAMIELFFKQVANKVPPNVLGDARELNKIVTLASIIEKETGASSERSVISSVFTKRLLKGMRLQSDPTVIYSLPKFDGNIRKKDLQYNSPYNTYVYKGLPPGPIANPGLASIVAALYPAETDYLYFVSKNNGEHHFSKTLREHNNAVRKYQLRRRR